ncbi:hypothetical protein EUX98_g1988 [Antrodiella citrinella]|uniref:Uncharacterized protein n=1 Tax=Antrodiella citrinella TaxID=2447956 RepID=A0A4V3XJ89_9APHY|nr:hypothetical protein EUX98_g1988 [Antrodiella citrinella]
MPLQQSLELVKYGLFAIHDTGAPPDKDDYPTLILLHGYAWHTGIFSRMVPFASKHGIRLVLVNRRDYPGATPFNNEQLKLLKDASFATPEAADALRSHIRNIARDLYDFLGIFIAKERPPKTGGITLAAWSFATVFLTALLAYGSEFPQGDIDITSYLRGVVNYDPPQHALGYPPLDDGYNPLFDVELSPGDRAREFALWVSGYYEHGETSSELNLRHYLSSPHPTLQTMSPEDVQSALYPGPGEPGGSDFIIMNAGIQHGSHTETRLKAYFLSETSTNKWDNVKLRHVWCDQSVWETPWSKFCLEKEFEDGKKAGKKIRPYEIVRMHKANHFIHWDQPERSLLVLLGDNEAAEGP